MNRFVAARARPRARRSATSTAFARGIFVVALGETTPMPRDPVRALLRLWGMKKSILVSLVVLVAAACSVDVNDDRDGVRTETEPTDPKTECTARCSEERQECASACVDDDDCVTACTDKARDCEVDCD